jgi:hypothetical protein
MSADCCGRDTTFEGLSADYKRSHFAHAIRMSASGHKQTFGIAQELPNYFVRIRCMRTAAH